MRLQEVSFKLNGAQVSLEVPPEERLADTLQWRLGVSSVKLGCGKGECGTCIVLIDGRPRHSCLTLTATLDGSEVVTLEGIAPSGYLHTVQFAYLRSGGVQCGFCTPGFIMTTIAMITHELEIDSETIREWLASVLCRCGSYLHYVRAAEKAFDLAKKGITKVPEREVTENIEEQK